MALLGIPGNENKFERFEKQDGGAETMSTRYQIVVRGVYNASNSLTIVNSEQRKANAEYKTHVARAAAEAGISQTQNLTVGNKVTPVPDMPSEVVAQDQPTAQMLDVAAAQQRVNDSHKADTHNFNLPR